MKARPIPPCPQWDGHTPIPGGYVTWFEWAHAMTAAGWFQQACIGCRAFVIWVHPDPTAIPLAAP